MNMPSDSFFTAVLHDGALINEATHSWSEHGEEMLCRYFGEQKRVILSTHPIKSITVSHGDMSTVIEVPEGHRVYQAIRAEAVFVSGQIDKRRIVGRVVGLVKDGEIVEERFLNGDSGEVSGIK
jgi:hypothetical protein